MTVGHSPSFAAALAQVEAVAGEPMELYPYDPRESAWVGRSASHFAYMADHPGRRARIILEAGRLRWAASVGVSVPPVVDHAPDGAWLVTRRVANDPGRGAGYVEAVTPIARAIESAPPPPAELLTPPGHWRAPRRSLVVRSLRMALSPLAIREFRELQRAALALPEDTPCHGDFHTRNVLYDATSRTACLVDWERFGYAARGTDLFTLWPTLLDADARAGVLEAALAGSNPAERARLGVLHRWLALRNLAIIVTEDRLRDRDRDRARAAADRVAEARRNVESWR